MPQRGDLKPCLYIWIYHLNRATLTFFMKCLVSAYTDHQHRKSQLLLCCQSLTLNHAVHVKLGLVFCWFNSRNAPIKLPCHCLVKAMLPCKAKMQYLFTLQVSRYCLLVLRSSMGVPLILSAVLFYTLGWLQMKWHEWGFRPPLCTYIYRISLSRGSFWGWWDEWDDTALQTQDSKLSPGGQRPGTEAPRAIKSAP